MPGPRNSKKKKAQKDKRGKAKVKAAEPPPAPSPPRNVDTLQEPLSTLHGENVSAQMLAEPCIYDPGSGPRVRDVSAFIISRWAAPPTLDDELCGAFAAPEVLDMLVRLPGLPADIAHILYYNRSRHVSRICPACRRLYTVGDALKDHFGHDDDDALAAGFDFGMHTSTSHASPQLFKEQDTSGLCSPICFILAFLAALPSSTYTLAHPLVQEGVRRTWGAGAEEMPDDVWDLLDAPQRPGEHAGLGLLLKMTRLEDLGLGQMWFPGEDFDSPSSAEASPAADAEIWERRAKTAQHEHAQDEREMEWDARYAYRARQDEEDEEEESICGSECDYCYARMYDEEGWDDSEEERNRGRSHAVKRIGSCTSLRLDLTLSRERRHDEGRSTDEREPGRGRSKVVKRVGSSARVGSQTAQKSQTWQRAVGEI